MGGSGRGLRGRSEGSCIQSGRGCPVGFFFGVESVIAPLHLARSRWQSRRAVRHLSSVRTTLVRGLDARPHEDRHDHVERRHVRRRSRALRRPDLLRTAVVIDRRVRRRGDRQRAVAPLPRRELPCHDHRPAARRARAREQRLWSNQSAAAGHSPCLPLATGEAYYNATTFANQMSTIAVDLTALQQPGTCSAPGSCTTTTQGY